MLIAKVYIYIYIYVLVPPFVRSVVPAAANRAPEPGDSHEGFGIALKPAAPLLCADIGLGRPWPDADTPLS